MLIVGLNHKLNPNFAVIAVAHTTQSRLLENLVSISAGNVEQKGNIPPDMAGITLSP